MKCKYSTSNEISIARSGGIKSGPMKKLPRRKISPNSKERVKKRIITKVNELLPVGTGVVQEVYFSEFIVM